MFDKFGDYYCLQYAKYYISNGLRHLVYSRLHERFYHLTRSVTATHSCFMCTLAPAEAHLHASFRQGYAGMKWAHRGSGHLNLIHIAKCFLLDSSIKYVLSSQWTHLLRVGCHVIHFLRMWNQHQNYGWMNLLAFIQHIHLNTSDEEQYQNLNCPHICLK